MSLKKTLILGLILAGLILYILRVEIPEREESARKDQIFRELEASKIDELELTNSHGSMKFEPIGERADEKWVISGFKDSFLEPSSVHALVNAISDLKLEAPLPKEDIDSDLSVYGLTPPALTIKFKTASDTNEIQIGKKNEFLGKRYLKLGGKEEVYLVPQSLYDAADKKAEDFRDKTPLDFLDRDLKSIELSAGKDTVVLEQGEERKWKLVKPLEAPASLEAVMDFTRNIRNLRASAFNDNYKSLADFALDKPSRRVTLLFTKAGKEEQRELIFSKTGKDDAVKHYLKVSSFNPVYELSSEPSFLGKGAQEFREKKVLAFSPDKVNSVKAEGQGIAPFAIQKEGQEWKVGSQPGDKVFIDQWLSDLSELEAESFVKAGSELGFGKPKYKLSLTLEGGEEKALTVGDQSKKDPKRVLYYASGGDSVSPFLLSEESYKKIARREEALLQPQPTPEASATATPGSPAASSQ